MIRIAAISAPPSHTLVRAATPLPSAPRQQAIPPVAASATIARLAGEATSAQSEAAFAMAAVRNATAPQAFVPGVEPLFADPLPDLPTIGSDEGDATDAPHEGARSRFTMRI